MVLLNSEVDCKNGQKGIYSLAVIIVTALLQTVFFFHLDTLYSTFSSVNGTSAPSVSAIEPVQDVKKINKRSKILFTGLWVLPTCL